ncbi:hypothetical protein [Falsibacillus pallidus]|uniref:Uncharacterized protein n=1 Tax=Falsibacillus pallidus TaxID=493781 RepID=A0A370G9G9_9BACI|nr:hypothetical protein [Falsibacillus pallidus]RDI39104.1 hypothetical protein DFR59_11511 [Falsibacillus pallidus]
MRKLTMTETLLAFLTSIIAFSQAYNHQRDGRMLLSYVFLIGGVLIVILYGIAFLKYQKSQKEER